MGSAWEQGALMARSNHKRQFPAFHLKVTKPPQPQGGWITFADGVNPATGATVTGLTNGVSYDFRVGAVNAIGQGGWSNIAQATPSAPSTPGKLHYVQREFRGLSGVIPHAAKRAS